MKGRLRVSYLACDDMGTKSITLTFLISSFYSVHGWQGVLSTFSRGVVLYSAYLTLSQSKHTFQKSPV
jgi:hypothetical protein